MHIDAANLLHFLHIYSVQALISHGAVVNKQDNIGNTPLHLGELSQLLYIL